MSTPATASRRPYQQDDVFRSMHVMDGFLSPDASFAVYQVSETVTGKEKNDEKQVNSLWRVDLAGGEPKRLTVKGVDASSPVKTPDGKAALFVSKRDPESQCAQIFRLPLDGGEAQPLTSLEQSVSIFAVSPDGNWIAFAATEKTPEKDAAPYGSVRIDRLAYRFDPVPGYLQDARHAIYLLPATGGEAKALTEHDGIFSALVWSPDSREIAAAVTGQATQPHWPGLSELFVLNRAGEKRVLLSEAFIMSVFWTPDGRQIGYFGVPNGNISLQNQLWLIDRNGGAPNSRTSDLGLPIGGILQTNSPAFSAALRAILTPDGKHIIVPVLHGGATEIYKIALSGPESAQAIVKGPRTVRPVDVVGTTLLCVSQDCNTPSELGVVDLNTGKDRTLTKHNAAWQAEIAWPEVERLVVKSSGGAEIEGWVLKPPHAKAPYKTLLYIHGGPHAAFGYSYCEDFQELVGAGYAVAFANPRGSVGYGDAFSTAIIGRWGKLEFDDFNALLDELVARKIADPDRLGVTGLSGGGHLSAWLIGHTNRFKAAVPEQGVYNMFSFYAISDAGVALATLEMGGHPHEQSQVYWELSPVAHAHKCKTPTLLIQGENDIRCPMEQAEQLYTILKYNGCKTEFLRLKDCNHGAELIGPPPLRRTRMDAMKDWFARYIK